MPEDLRIVRHALLTTELMKQNERLLSLDALRGFDMLFIMGFSGLIAAICALWPSPLTDAVARQMGHVSWNGLTQHDTIFPLFLFIAGVSFPFSLAKQRVVGVSERRILFKVIRRGVTLVILGMVYNGLLRFDFASLRMASVLGRIGLAWMFAALLYMYCGLRTRIAFAAVVLIGYSLLICLVVAPDAPDGSDPLSVTGNIAGWVDRQWLPGTLACGSFDPEGLLSTLPAIVSALFGMFTGEFLLRKRLSLSGGRIALYIALAAAAITVIGIIWNCWIPINKKLWSSSFTCVVTGYSLGLFALFYYLIDVRGWKRWTFFFRVIGLNSITIYLAQRIVGFGGIANFFFGGAASHCPEAIARVISNAGYVAICWLFLYFLYRKSTFLKV